MGIEELTAALKNEADKEEAAMVAMAERRVGEIQAEADARLAAIGEEAGRIEAKCRVAEEALRSGAEKIAVRNRLSNAGQAYAAAVREECRTLFHNFMQTPAYTDFAVAQYRLAAAELGTVEQVMADARTAAALTDALEKDTALKINESAADGFAAYGPGGRVVVWSTFETRFEKAWARGGPACARAIAEAVKHGI